MLSSADFKTARSLNSETVFVPVRNAMFIVVVVTDFHILKHRESIVCKDSERKVKRQKIGRDAKRIQSHQAGGKAGRDFSWNSGLMQTDDTLILLPDSNEDDVRSCHTTGWIRTCF